MTYTEIKEYAKANPRSKRGELKGESLAVKVILDKLRILNGTERAPLDAPSKGQATYPQYLKELQVETDALAAEHL